MLFLGAKIEWRKFVKCFSFESFCKLKTSHTNTSPHIPPSLRVEHDNIVVRLGAIGEGRARHGQQVWVCRHQRGLRGAQQAPAGTAHAAVACQCGPNQRSPWRTNEERQTETSIFMPCHFCGYKASARSAASLTCELWNDGRRVLVQVVHSSRDGVGGNRDSRHHHPAVVWVKAGGQARQTRIIDHREAAELLDLLPAVEPLPQARRYLRQGFPNMKTNEWINQTRLN